MGYTVKIRKRNPQNDRNKNSSERMDVVGEPHPVSIEAGLSVK
jgi:hypothetical protein